MATFLSPGAGLDGSASGFLCCRKSPRYFKGWNIPKLQDQIEVAMDRFEIETAEAVRDYTQKIAGHLGQSHRGGAIKNATKEESSALQLVGFLGQLAACKHFNEYPIANIGRSGCYDCGPYEIRSTTHKSGCLIIHDTESESRKCVLAVVHIDDDRTSAIVRLVGWITAKEGRTNENHQRAGRLAVYSHGTYFVTQSDLHELHTINYDRLSFAHVERRQAPEPDELSPPWHPIPGRKRFH